MDKMKIFVKAKTGQKTSAVEKILDNTFIVKVKELPENGLANQAIIVALADRLNIPKSSIKILSGHTSKTKLIQIMR